jgi:hypothetical protein
MRNTYKILFGKPEGKIPLRRPAFRWEDNIGVDFEVLVYVDFIHLLQHRVQWRVLPKTVVNLRIPYKSDDFLTSGATVSFLRRTLLH